MKYVVPVALYGGILLALAGGAAAVATLTPNPPANAVATVKANDLAPLAKRLGQQAVLMYLKHPHDAKFNNNTNASQARDGSWVAAGTVKAPNGFGNPTTSEWAVFINVRGGRMQVRDVVIDGQYVTDDRPEWAR